MAWTRLCRHAYIGKAFACTNVEDLKPHINIPVVSHRNPEIITLEHESIVDHAYIVDSDTQCVIFGVLPIGPLSTDSMRDSMC